jgi:hypothetical protein
MATKKPSREEQLSVRRQQIRDEHATAVREKIQVTQIVERLQKFALGDSRTKVTSAQLKAMEMLLDKTVPNLASVKHEVDAKQVTFLIDTSVPDGPANNSVPASG